MSTSGLKEQGFVSTNLMSLCSILSGFIDHAHVVVKAIEHCTKENIPYTKEVFLINWDSMLIYASNDEVECVAIN